MNVQSIGETAGKVWKILGSQERVSTATLPKLVGEDGGLVQLALGWLAREGKVEFEKQGKSVFAKLTPQEAEAYKQAGNSN